MNKIQIFTHKNKFHEDEFIFKIHIRNGLAYMKIGKSFLGRRNIGGPENIIIVDSNKFLELGA